MGGKPAERDFARLEWIAFRWVAGVSAGFWRRDVRVSGGRLVGRPSSLAMSRRSEILMPLRLQRARPGREADGRMAGPRAMARMRSRSERPGGVSASWRHAVFPKRYEFSRAAGPQAFPASSS